MASSHAVHQVHEDQGHHQFHQFHASNSANNVHCDNVAHAVHAVAQLQAVQSFQSLLIELHESICRVHLTLTLYHAVYNTVLLVIVKLLYCLSAVSVTDHQELSVISQSDQSQNKYV